MQVTTRYATRKTYELVAIRQGHGGSRLSDDLLAGLLRELCAAASKSKRDNLSGGRLLSRWNVGPGYTHNDGVLINPVRWRAEALAAVLRGISEPDPLLAPSFDRFASAGFHGARKTLGVRHLVAARGAARSWPVDGPRADALADYVGRRTRVSYNDCHPNACEVCRVLIEVSAAGYALVVKYTLPSEMQESWAHHDPVSHYSPSSWEIPPNGVYNARSAGIYGPTVPPKAGETFGEFVERAQGVMERVLAPSAEVEWFAWSVRRFDGGNEHRPPRPDESREEALVLAPSERDAVDYWRAAAGLPASVQLAAARDWTGPAALLPPLPKGPVPAPREGEPNVVDRRCAVALRGPRWGSPSAAREGELPDGMLANRRRMLLAMARAPFRSSLRLHREVIWPDQA